MFFKKKAFAFIFNPDIQYSKNIFIFNVEYFKMKI